MASRWYFDGDLKLCSDAGELLATLVAETVCGECVVTVSDSADWSDAKKAETREAIENYFEPGTEVDITFEK